MTNAVFPGLPATLNVTIREKFDDPKEVHDLRKVYYFNNEVKNPLSFIIKVHIWEEKNHEISQVLCFFHKSGCELMQQAFSGMDLHLKEDLNHFHKHSWCIFSVTDKDQIRLFLDIIKKNHKFTNNAETELTKVLAKL